MAFSHYLIVNKIEYLIVSVRFSSQCGLKIRTVCLDIDIGGLIRKNEKNSIDRQSDLENSALQCCLGSIHLLKHYCAALISGSESLVFSALIKVELALLMFSAEQRRSFLTISESDRINIECP